MSQTGNAFQKAAEALGEVRSLILSGEQLQKDLGKIISQADASSKRVEQVLKAETTALSRSAQEVLGQYKTASKEIAGGILKANEQLEATTAQIKATAIHAVTELNQNAETAIKRVTAEVTIAHDRFDKSSQTIEFALDNATDRIIQASERVDRGTSIHGDRLEQVSHRLGEVLAAYEEGAKAILSAEQYIRLAKQETIEARLETTRAKDEVVSLRESMRKQVRLLTIGVVLLFLTALAAVAWTFLRTFGE